MDSTPQPTVVSAPGKVLVAGGYLVLDSAYSGVVISTSSRFYTTIQSLKPAAANTIRVRSPQFNDSTWTYSLSFDTSSKVDSSPTNSSKNKFVHLALQHTISLSCEVRGVLPIQNLLAKGLDIAIVGDNDFYSQRSQLAALNLPRTLSSLAAIPPFCPQGVTLNEVHKTGLGSSAALITSLVSGLLVHLGVIPRSALQEDQGRERELAHNLAQFIHCLAQGKVGSGFDVSAAVFGSHLYTRFDPNVIAPLMGDHPMQPRLLLPVVSPDNASWNHRIRPFQLPPLTRLMLADVDAGSDTPSLIGQVQKWRKANPEKANAVWNAIDQLNQSLSSTLLRISTYHSKDPANYASIVKFISTLQPMQWTADPSLSEFETEVAYEFHQAHLITLQIRRSMKEMGDLAGAPIEPVEQTELLDQCCFQAGVIGGGVPGAGGYDAVWMLMCEPEQCRPDLWPRERIEHFWSNYTKLDVSPLSAVESLAKGARLESIDEINGLREVTQTA
ncbi:phosphomevalonate kinase [Lentinula aciculospora]|uniref:Phosphomevalonate kinase n=1 Tax=Lentinula aciculospora TaxID=153920 RepID=A0A9W9AJU9_9AGAR|nr:phosphomevalonate kinase [Lentinula aciculospora]